MIHRDTTGGPQNGNGSVIDVGEFTGLPHHGHIIISDVQPVMLESDMGKSPNIWM